MEPQAQNQELNALGVTDEEARQIGIRLQAKRKENAKITIRDFANRLKLNESYIELIENGDWHSLPQSANGRGFIRLYARELKVELPEFDKFLDTQKSLAAPRMQTNLDKIVECARAKRLVQMTAFQIGMMRVGPLIKNLFTTKNFESADTEPSNDTEVQIQNAHKKKWIFVGSLGVFIIGTTLTTLFIKHTVSSNVDIADQANEEDENLSPRILANAQSVETHTVQPQVETKSAQVSKTPDPVPTNMAADIRQAEQTNIPSNTLRTSDLGQAQSQNMKIDILSPVAIIVETDGKQVLNGLTKPGVINFEFQKKAVLIIQDSSKVKLSYAGWENDLLSLGTRKRTIVLNAKRFRDENQ